MPAGGFFGIPAGEFHQCQLGEIPLPRFAVPLDHAAQHIGADRVRQPLDQCRQIGHEPGRLRGLCHRPLRDCFEVPLPANLAGQCLGIGPGLAGIAAGG